MSRSIGLFVNGPNVLLKKFSFSLGDILNAVKGMGRIVVGKVILNHNTPQKLIEAMKLIYNPKINALALAVTDSHFLPVFD